MKEGDEVEIPILKTPIITWRYYRRKVQNLLYSAWTTVLVSICVQICKGLCV